MLRRFSINYAIFSMLLDYIWVVIGLWFSTLIRPYLNRFQFIQPIPDDIHLPLALYFIFPLVWISVFAAFSIYDGRKNLRTVDEYTLLTLATILAAISMAGILFLSFRLVSRALYIFFVFTSLYLIVGLACVCQGDFSIAEGLADFAVPYSYRRFGTFGDTGVRSTSKCGYWEPDLCWIRRMMSMISRIRLVPDCLAVLKISGKWLLAVISPKL